MKSCPHCQRILEEVAVGRLRVDGCSGCGGIWFEARELTQLTQRHREEMSDLENRFRDAGGLVIPTRERRCPNCYIPLFPFEFPQARGIHLDGCRQCRGIWLDDGELAAIEERLQERSTKPPSDRTEATAAATPPDPQPPSDPLSSECPPPRERPADPLQPPSPPEKPPLEAMETTAAPEAFPGTLTSDFPAPWERGPDTSPVPSALPKERLEKAASFLSRSPCPRCGEPNLAREAVCWACGKPLQHRSTPVRVRTGSQTGPPIPIWLAGVLGLLCLGTAVFLGVRTFLGPRQPALQGRVDDFAVPDPGSGPPWPALNQEWGQKTGAAFSPSPPPPGAAWPPFGTGEGMAPEMMKGMAPEMMKGMAPEMMAERGIPMSASPGAGAGPPVPAPPGDGSSSRHYPRTRYWSGTWLFFMLVVLILRLIRYVVYDRYYPYWWRSSRDDWESDWERGRGGWGRGGFWSGGW